MTTYKERATSHRPRNLASINCNLSTLIPPPMATTATLIKVKEHHESFDILKMVLIVESTLFQTHYVDQYNKIYHCFGPRLSQQLDPTK